MLNCFYFVVYVTNQYRFVFPSGLEVEAIDGSDRVLCRGSSPSEIATDLKTKIKKVKVESKQRS